MTLSIQTVPYKANDFIPITAAADITAGDPQQIVSKSLVGIPLNDIAAAAADDLLIKGVVRGWKVTGAMTDGQPIGWDDNGSPLGGTASSGAYTCDPTAVDFWVGTVTEDAAAAATEVKILLNEFPEYFHLWRNRSHVNTAIDLTWAAATHNGKVIHVTADAKTVTMPVGVAGMEAIIVNDVADAGSLLTVDFNGNETLEGALAIAATKTALNTKATAIRGDFLHIVCETAASLWRVVGIRGTWVTST